MTRRTAQDSIWNTAKLADKVSVDSGRNPGANTKISDGITGAVTILAHGFVARLANIDILAATRFAP